MLGAAHEEIAVHQGFAPLSRATANTLYNKDTAIADAVGIDLQGYDEGLISIYAGAVAAGASIVYTIFTADENDAEHASLAVAEKADGTDVAATIADTEDNTIELIRIRPQDLKRYLFIRRVQTGAFAAVESVTVMLTKKRTGKPVTQPSGTTVAFNMDT
jgi:hypothetical protein